MGICDPISKDNTGYRLALPPGSIHTHSPIIATQNLYYILSVPPSLSIILLSYDLVP